MNPTHIVVTIDPGPWKFSLFIRYLIDVHPARFWFGLGFMTPLLAALVGVIGVSVFFWLKRRFAK